MSSRRSLKRSRVGGTCVLRWDVACSFYLLSSTQSVQKMGCYPNVDVNTGCSHLVVLSCEIVTTKWDGCGPSGGRIAVFYSAVDFIFNSRPQYHTLVISFSMLEENATATNRNIELACLAHQFAEVVISGMIASSGMITSSGMIAKWDGF